VLLREKLRWYAAQGYICTLEKAQLLIACQEEESANAGDADELTHPLNHLNFLLFLQGSGKPVQA
jgi:hypothetical protein